MTRTTLVAVAVSLVAILSAGCDGGDTGGSAGSTGGSAGTGGSAAGSAGTGGSAAGSAGTGGTGGTMAMAPDISGKWSSGCVGAPQPDGSTQYLSLDFDITATDWALDYKVYGDMACATGFLTVHINGPYDLTGPSATVTDAWEGTFSFDAKTATPESDMAVGFLQSLGACGTGMFTAGSPTDILTDGCAGLGMYPKAMCSSDSDLVQIDAGGKLHFGQRPADNNMCTPDKRPTMLSPLGLTKQ